MPESIQNTELAGSVSGAGLLTRTATAVRAAGSVLRERFGDVVRHQTRDELMRALAANDDAALGVLRPHLCPCARTPAGWRRSSRAGPCLPANGGSWTRPRATSTTCTACRTGR